MDGVLLWLGVGVLGGAGAIARFLVDGVVSGSTGRAFPLGTLVVNASGSAILGLLAGLALGGNGYLLAGTATIGSYTTFSTWAFESQRLAEEGSAALALANVLVSLIVGVGAAAAGRAVGGS